MKAYLSKPGLEAVLAIDASRWIASAKPYSLQRYNRSPVFRLGVMAFFLRTLERKQRDFMSSLWTKGFDEDLANLGSNLLAKGA